MTDKSLVITISQNDPVQVVVPPATKDERFIISAKYCSKAGRIKLVVLAPARVRVHRPGQHET